MGSEYIEMKDGHSIIDIIERIDKPESVESEATKVLREVDKSGVIIALRKWLHRDAD